MILETSSSWSKGRNMSSTPPPPPQSGSGSKGTIHGPIFPAEVEGRSIGPQFFLEYILYSKGASPIIPGIVVMGRVLTL
jgi:hypothetical protein